jgi:plastocyanin
MKKFILLLSAAFILVINSKAVTHIITVQNIVFTPATLNVNLGDTIKWQWVNGTHTCTSLMIPAGAASWNVNMTKTSKTFTYVPAVAGLYNYQCNIHFMMGMVGNFTVVCPKPVVNITAGSTTTFCSGGSVFLSSTTTGGVTNFQWNLKNVPISGQTNPTLTATTAGSYTLTVSNACGNKDTSNAITVKVNALPAAKITPAGTFNLCSGKDTLLTATAGSNFDYQWIRNNVSIGGATHQTFTATQAGSYKVMITNSSTGCSKTSAVTKIISVKCTTVLSAMLPDEVKIYPDPVDQTLTFSMTNDLRGGMEISIYNALGQKVKTVSVTKDEDFIQHDIDMSGIAPGLYLVRVNTSESQIVQKFIKK